MALEAGTVGHVLDRSDRPKFKTFLQVRAGGSLTQPLESVRFAVVELLSNWQAQLVPSDRQQAVGAAKRAFLLFGENPQFVGAL